MVQSRISVAIAARQYRCDFPLMPPKRTVMAMSRIPCTDCGHGKLRATDAVYADCDNCDAAVLRNEVGI